MTGQEFRDLRKSIRITQRALARELACAPETICRLEKSSSVSRRFELSINQVAAEMRERDRRDAA